MNLKPSIPPTPHTPRLHLADGIRKLPSKLSATMALHDPTLSGQKATEKEAVQGFGV